MVVISFLGLDVGKPDYVTVHVNYKEADQPVHPQSDQGLCYSHSRNYNS